MAVGPSRVVGSEGSTSVRRLAEKGVGGAGGAGPKDREEDGHGHKGHRIRQGKASARDEDTFGSPVE